MVKRLLVLLMLTTALVICEQESVVVHADACSDCNTAWESCVMQAANARVDCINDDTPIEICDEEYGNHVSSCDNTWNYCLSTNCGGGGGGGGSNCDLATSYNCVQEHKAQRDVCLTEGSEGSLYQQCIQTSYQEYCCNQQLDYEIQTTCTCNLDPRNPDCKPCYSL